MNNILTLNLAIVLDALRVRWKWLPLCASVAAIAAYFAAQLYEPPHIATAKVLVQENASVNPFLSDMMVEWSVKTRLPVITNVARSRQTAERLLTTQGVLTPQTPPAERERALKAYQRRLTIYSLGGGVVQLKFRGDTPDEAFEGIQLLMQFFSDEMLRPQKQALDQSVAFLQEQVARIRQELHAHEQDLRRFKEENSDELPEVFRANLDTYLKALQDRLDTSAELAARNKTLKLTRERLLAFDPQAQKLEAELLSARQSLESMEASLQPTHPRVQAARAHVRALEKKRASALARAKRNSSRKVRELESMASLTSDSRVLKDKPVDLLTHELLSYRESQNEVGALSNRLSLIDAQARATMRKVRAFAKHEQSLRSLERDIETKTQVYTSLLQRYENALVTRELTLRGEASRVWLIEPPTRPAGTRPVSPKVATIGGGLAGLFLALTLVFLFEFLSKEVRHTGDITSVVEAPIWLELPSLPTSEPS